MIHSRIARTKQQPYKRIWTYTRTTATASRTCLFARESFCALPVVKNKFQGATYLMALANATKDDAGFPPALCTRQLQSIDKTLLINFTYKYHPRRKINAIYRNLWGGIFSLIFRQYYNNVISLRTEYVLNSYIVRPSSVRKQSYDFITMIFCLPSFKRIGKSK